MIELTESEITRNWSVDVSMPMVSICCITYNHQDYIEKCLDGFLMQKTDFPFEIVIDDDCSSDGTKEIIDKYQRKYSNIIKANFRSHNIGPIRNFFDNLSKATGEYIAICEGDDFWIDPKKLQIQKDFLESNPNFSLHAHSVEILDDTEKFSAYNPYTNIDKDIFSFEDVLMNHFIPTPSLFFRRTHLPDPLPSFVRNIRNGDIALELMLIAQGKGFYDERIMAVYRHHDGGITKYRQPSISEERKLTYRLYNGIDELTEYKYHKLIRTKLAFLEYAFARASLSRGEYIEGVNSMFRSLLNDILFIPHYILKKVFRWNRGF